MEMHGAQASSYTMKWVLCMVVLISAIYAEKEIPEEGSLSGLSPKLWKIIEKRLKDYGYDDIEDLRNELDDPHCTNHEVNNNTIIRTHDSRAAGATYIDSPEVTSREDCLQECCAISTCNIAVFKEVDQDRACYLFDCGTPNICLFSNHPGYAVLKLSLRTTSDKVQEKHENDLQNLAVETTTTTTTSTTTTTVPTTPEIKSPVPLFGECNVPEDCAVTYSSCIENYCLCKDGYHDQEGICRPDCSKFEFECINRGQPLALPQCVGIYNRCDGIALCLDKSDEDNCNSGNKGSSGRTHSTGLSKGEGSRPSHVEDQDADSHVDKNPLDSAQKSKSSSKSDEDQEAVPPVVQDDTPQESDTDKSPEVDHLQQSSAAGDDDSSADQSSESKTQLDTRQDQEPQEGANEASMAEDDSASSSQEEEEEEEDEDDDGTSVVVDEEKSKDEKKALNSEFQDVENTGIIVTKEKVHDKEFQLSQFYKANRGAVIALSLGLAITALLLIFVGCRLRNVKKRLRKGRPLNSNEADYLINGMYL